MTRTDIINYFFDSILGYKKHYLEIGLGNPYDNYINVRCAYKECVDPIKEERYTKFYNIDNILTYRMTSDEFFATNKKKYDLIFIDGLHIGSQVVKDIINSYSALNDGGYIILHDCLPLKEEHQLDDSKLSLTKYNCWNGSVWRAIINLYRADINYNTVDTDQGCCIIKYNGSKDFSNYIETSLSYNEAFSNTNVRNTLMHVITEKEFLKIYK